MKIMSVQCLSTSALSTLLCKSISIHSLYHPVVVVNPLLPAYWGESVSGAFWGSPPASPASLLAGLLRRRDPSTNPGLTAWCETVGN